MIHYALLLSLTLIGIAIAGCAYRLVKGPSKADRIAALDTIGICLLAMVSVLSLLLETRNYIEIILLVGILTFIGTTAFARYIERGAVFEHGDDSGDSR